MVTYSAGRIVFVDDFWCVWTSVGDDFIPTLLSEAFVESRILDIDCFVIFSDFCADCRAILDTPAEDFAEKETRLKADLCAADEADATEPARKPKRFNMAKIMIHKPDQAVAIHMRSPCTQSPQHINF